MEKLKDMGYDEVRLIDTTIGILMTKLKTVLYSLRDSAFLFEKRLIFSLFTQIDIIPNYLSAGRLGRKAQESIQGLSKRSSGHAPINEPDHELLLTINANALPEKTPISDGLK